jgi:hypothetical protein
MGDQKGDHEMLTTFAKINVKGCHGNCISRNDNTSRTKSKICVARLDFILLWVPFQILSQIMDASES